MSVFLVRSLPLLYFAIIWLLSLMFRDSLLVDVLAGPMFIVLPAGVGLSLISYITFLKPKNRDSSSTVGGLERSVLVSPFVGMAIIASGLAALELGGFLERSFGLIAWSFLIFSAIGWVIWLPTILRLPFFKVSFPAILWSLPVIVGFYWFYYFWTASYPLRDVFQNVHFLKGAVELSKFSILNPATGDTYVAVIQSHMGLLSKTFGVDVFRSQWTVAPMVAVFQLLIALTVPYCLGIRDTGSLTTIACVNVIARKNIFSWNNGDLLICMITLLFAEFLRTSRKEGNCWGACKMILSGVLTLAILWLLHLSFANYSILIISILCLHFLSIVKFPSAESSIWTGLIMAVGMSLHRTILSYTIAIVVLALVYILMDRMSVLSFRKFKDRLRWGMIFLFVLYVFLIIFTAVAPEVARGLKQVFTFDFVYDIAGFVLRKKIDSSDPIQTGGGMGQAYIEWIRIAPPLFHSLAFGAATVAFSKSDLDFVQMRGATTIFFLFVVAVALTVNPLPYWYRNSPLAVLLGTVLIGYLLSVRDVRIAGRIFRLDRALTGFLTLYTILRAAYHIWLYRVSAQPEFSYLIHLTFILLVISVITFAATILFHARRVEGRRAKLVLLLIAIVSALSFEQILLFSRFYNGAYRWRESPARVISHYSRDEFESASWIARDLIKKPTAILVSDVSSMAILKALTGVSGVLSFSNISIISPDYRKPLALLIDAMEKGDRHLVEMRAEEFINVFPGPAAIPEARYVYEARGGKALIWNNVRENLFFVLTSRSIRWKNCVLSGDHECDAYFTDSTPLPGEVFAAIDRSFATLGRTATAIVFRLP